MALLLGTRLLFRSGHKMTRKWKWKCLVQQVSPVISPKIDRPHVPGTRAHVLWRLDSSRADHAKHNTSLGDMLESSTLHYKNRCKYCNWVHYCERLHLVQSRVLESSHIPPRTNLHFSSILPRPWSPCPVVSPNAMGPYP